MATYDRIPTARPTDGAVPYDASIDTGLRAYMLQVYNYMATGLAITGVAAAVLLYFATASSPEAGGIARVATDLWLTELGVTLYTTPLKWVLMLAPLAVVFFLSFRVHKMSPSAARGTFYLYATLVGLSMSTIFLMFDESSIARVFFITAASFAALSLYGYTTKRDLTGMGTFLMMGVFGLMIAMVVNIFLQSSGLEWAISIIGVLVFAGLTAYDTQKIKEMYYVGDDGTVTGRKAVIGALTLYLDFVLLFQFLMSLLGSNRE